MTYLILTSSLTMNILLMKLSITAIKKTEAITKVEMLEAKGSLTADVE